MSANKTFSAMLLLFAAVAVSMASGALLAGMPEAADHFKEYIAAAPAGEHPAVITAEQNGASAILLRADGDWSDPASILWQWIPSQAPELTAQQAKWFANISDVKPVMGGKALLTVASGGGVALVRMEDKKVLFLGFAGGNTHSAALLPDGNVVSASSTGAFLRLFVRSDDPAVVTEVKHKDYPLTDAHGVVWDPAREVLWAVGEKTVAGYRYQGTQEDPELEALYSIDFPEGLFGGHDLYPMPGEDVLLFTTNTGVGIFDPATRAIEKVSDHKYIKSISIDSGGAVIVMIPVEQWWSDTISYFAPGEPAVGTYPKAKFYKARWWMPNSFSEPTNE